MTEPRYSVELQYGEWCIIDQQPGIRITLAVGCPIGRGGTDAGKTYATHIVRKLNTADCVPDLLGMIEILCNGIEWNIENHPNVMNESDAEALQEARELIAKIRS